MQCRWHLSKAVIAAVKVQGSVIGSVGLMPCFVKAYCSFSSTHLWFGKILDIERRIPCTKLESSTKAEVQVGEA